MKAARLLPLDAPERVVSDFLLCQAILGHMNRELALIIHKHSKTLDRLASRPHAEFPQAVARQIFPRDPSRVPR